jgi:RNA polymerase sigma factor (sigma-70 family)
MTEELLGRGGPVTERLQQAFADEEPATDLAAVMQRAARYQAGEPPGVYDPPRPGHGLTQADLVAARRREPAAVTRIYSAYAPALFRFFAAEVGNRHEAEELTGSVFVSAVEALPGFRGPVEALGGWLFRIARNDLYDFRRRQVRSPDRPARGRPGRSRDRSQRPGGPRPQSGAQTASWSGQLTHPALNRLSQREREILGLLAKGWSSRRIAEECFLSPNIVRTHVQNILVKLGVHSKLEAVAFALKHGWTSGPEDLNALAMGRLDDTQVVAALPQLAPDQREVMLLSMVAGLTAPEVATALGKTVSEVKALHQRARAALAAVLDLPSSY